MQADRNILILGASPFTVPLIKMAGSQGLHTIVCSNIPTDPGLAVADVPLVVSILDRDKLNEVMAEYKPVAIVTAASDLATLSIGYLNQKYGLQGITEEQVLSITDKGKFTELQQRLKMPAPTSIVVTAEDLQEQVDVSSLVFPMIMKPFFSSGSRGVKVVRAVDELLAHHHTCRQASSGRKGYVLQGFLSEYKEVGCEVFVEHGKVVFLQTTHKYLNKFQVPTGHCVPGPVVGDELEALTDQIEQVCKALDVRYSPINLDVMVKPGHPPIIIDMSFRLGGNLLPDIMEEAYGTKPYNRVLSYSLDNKSVGDIDMNTKGFTGSLVFGSLTSQPFTESLQAEIEALLVADASEVVFDFPIGHQMPVFTQGSYRFGHALVRTSTLAEYEALYNKLQSIING